IVSLNENFIRTGATGLLTDEWPDIACYSLDLCASAIIAHDLCKYLYNDSDATKHGGRREYGKREKDGINGKRAGAYNLTISVCSVYFRLFRTLSFSILRTLPRLSS